MIDIQTVWNDCSILNNKYLKLKTQYEVKYWSPACFKEDTLAKEAYARNPDFCVFSKGTSDFRMKSMLQKLSDSGVLIIFFTGRNKTETAFKQTDEWLSKNFDFPWILYMRGENDFRHSDICKEEMYSKYIKDKYNVLCAFDDCIKCINMWRKLGILCCAVANNEY